MTPDQLREWRAALGLTQAAAGARLGVTGRAVRRWEAGDRKIPRTVAILCGAYIAARNAQS
jgi:transcriptional regulator with XRE-family HTH domain